LKELILYRGLKYQKLFDQMLSQLAPQAEHMKETMPESFACAGQLIELAASYGFEVNLWHCFLALCLADHENAYSTSCEITGPVKGTLNEVAAHDFQVMKELFDQDIRKLDRGEEEGIWAALSDYHSNDGNSKIYNRRIRDQIVTLAVKLKESPDVRTFGDIITEFYRNFGVGKFGLNKAFRVEETDKDPEIIPITSMDHIYLSDLVGYERQKEKLIENTEAFLNGRAANNVLLFGDSGTGKSSSIKAILNEYYDKETGFIAKGVIGIW